MKNRKKRYCSRCNGKVVRETIKLVNYPFYCPTCDENMFICETYKTKSKKTNKVLMTSKKAVEIAIGTESDLYFVQTCCNEEHTGQHCGCQPISEKVSLEEAERIAKKKSKELNIPVKRWF